MKFKLLFLPLSLVVALFVFVYFIKPMWDNYQGNKKELAKSEQDLESIKNSKQSLDNSLAIFREVDTNKKFLLGNSLPVSLQEENLFRELNDIAAGSGVRIIESSLRKVDDFERIKDLQENNGIESTRSELVLNSNYLGLRRFISLLENTNRYIKVEKFEISSNRELGNLDLNLEVVFFHKEANQSQFSLNDPYFRALLKDGLSLAVIDEYMAKREKVINFSAFELGDLGTNDLFEASRVSTQVTDLGVGTTGGDVQITNTTSTETDEANGTTDSGDGSL